MKNRLAPSAAKLTLAAAMLLAATPAMASDFSDLIYIFLGFFAVIAFVVLAIVLGIRRSINQPGPKTDAVSAIILALVFAPSTFVNNYGSWDFFLWPVSMMAMFSESWWDMVPGPAISVLVTAVLIYLFLKSRRTPADPEAEPE